MNGTGADRPMAVFEKNQKTSMMWFRFYFEETVGRDLNNMKK